ncbi:MAG: DNA alkylation repair protein [Thermoleophilia bacterium]
MLQAEQIITEMKELGDRETALDDTLELLKSPFHEARLLALFMLVARYSKGAGAEQQAIYRACLGNTEYVNNWDLVDSSAAYIVGAYLAERDRKPLSRLVRSKNLWERRISIMSTFRFIRDNDFTDAIAISELLLRARGDLPIPDGRWSHCYAAPARPGGSYPQSGRVDAA